MSRHRKDGRGSRRSRSPGAVDLSGTLGSLLRNTLQQVGAVRDVVERQARTSLEQLDSVMLQRNRRDALTRLGELIWDLARSGEMPATLGELATSAEFAELIDELDELEERIASESAPSDPYARTDSHRGSGPRRDQRGDQRDSYESESTGSRWSRRDISDGTVSSANWRPPAPREGDRSSRQRGSSVPVWRPTRTPPTTAPGPEIRAADQPDPSANHAADATDEPDAAQRGQQEPQNPVIEAAENITAPARTRRRRSRTHARDASSPGGGIAFVTDAVHDEDDDLSEYMHEDDLPAK